MHGRSQLGLTLLVVVSLCVASSAAAAPPAGSDSKSPAQANAIDAQRRLDAGEFNLWHNNTGSHGYNIQGGAPGLEYPRGSGQHVVFAGGLWLGALVNGTPHVTVSEYSDDYGPGGMPGGVVQPASDPRFKVYKVTRWTGNPQDSAHVEHSAAELAANPELDPIIHHSWSEYVLGAGPSGAPLRSYRLDKVSTPAPGDSVDIPGPDVKGDQMTWCVFNDGDPSRHFNRAGSHLPLGVEVRRTCYTFATRGIHASTTYIEYEIVNRGGQTLSNFLAALWTDADLGGFSDDLVGSDVTSGLVYTYNAPASDAVYGNAPPAVGVMILQGPVLANGDTLRAYASTQYTNGAGPSDSTETYNNLFGLHENGSAQVDPTTSLVSKFACTGDPVASTGWRDTIPSDKRMMISTGPFTLQPGATTKVVAAIVLAQGEDRLSSIALLRREARFVRDRYLNGSEFNQPDLAIVRHHVPPLIDGCEPTAFDFRVLNFGPDTGPFSTDWRLAPVVGLGGQELFADETTLASGAALEKAAVLELDEHTLATDLRATLSVDNSRSLSDPDRLNNVSNIATSHAVPAMRSLAQVSAGSTPQARVRFARSFRDSAVSLSPVTQYEVYRRIEGPASAGSLKARAAAARSAGMVTDDAMLVGGWDFVAAVPAHGTSDYSVVVPLLPDPPSPSGYQAFAVRAATVTPTVYFTSCVDSMPQVDSLPPSMPANLRVSSVSAGGDVALAWDPVTAPDLRQYRVYRGATPNFVPGPANLMGLRTTAGFLDPAAASGGVVAYYKVSSEDLVGNVSGFALTGSGTVGVSPPPIVRRFALDAPRPNPSSAGQSFRFALSESGEVELGIYDLAGRLVRRALHAAQLPAGEHAWQWDARDDDGRRLPPGLYLARLRAGGHMAERRALLIE